MFWWVASPLVLGHTQNAEVLDLLQRLRPSLAYLGDVRHPTGAAALVDTEKGLYLAHTDAVEGDTVQGKVGDWRVSLRVLGEDPRTGLVVLGLKGGAPREIGPALEISADDPQPGTKVCVLVADGGLMGTYVGGQRLMSFDNKPIVPASEIRFEAPRGLVGGALVVTFEGKLVGTMGATVASPGRSSSISMKALGDVRRGLIREKIDFRPGPLTLAFSPSLTLFRRSVAGLVTDSHRPDYAALGIQVGDTPGLGAIIRRVVGDSPAARARVQVNDVLLAVGDHPIHRQYDFLQAMLAYHPGDRIVLRILHDGVERRVEVVLARSR